MFWAITPLSAYLGRYFRAVEECSIISYQRDRFVETSELTFPLKDDISGTIRGYRVFTACRTVNGKIFRVEDHLDRLYHSAYAIHMQPPLPREELRILLDDLIQRNFELNSGRDLHVDVIFSGGLLGTTLKQSGKGAYLYVAISALETAVGWITSAKR